MAQVVKFYEDFMTTYSDTRVSTWSLVDTPMPTLCISATYLALVLLFLPAYMKNRKPYKLITVIRVYNIVQIVACCIIIYTMTTAGWLTGEYSFGCQPVDYSDNPKAVRLLTGFYWFYLLKLVELIETVFFILRKKFNQVSALHIYHHTSTFLLAFIGCKFVGGGMVSIPLILNSFIHVLMYTYYYLSSLGPKWQKTLAPWKPKLTMAQMIQFTLLILHSMSVLQPDCKVSKKLLLIYIPNVVLIFKMFYDFYTESYSKKRKQK